MTSMSGPTALRKALHHAPDLVDLRQGRVVMRVGDEHGLEGRIALCNDLMGARQQRLGVQCLVDGPHVAQAEMGVDADLVANLAAEQAPHGHAERLAEDVPERHLDAGDGAHPDHAEAPEAVLLQHPHGLFDVARVASDQKRREILDGPDHGLGFPLQRRLAPADEVGTVGLDTHEDPVAHLGVHNARRQAGDLQRMVLHPGAYGPERRKGAALKRNRQ